jgi:hypothetical protein
MLNNNIMNKKKKKRKATNNMECNNVFPDPYDRAERTTVFHTPLTRNTYCIYTSFYNSYTIHVVPTTFGFIFSLPLVETKEFDVFWGKN